MGDTPTPTLLRTFALDVEEIHASRDGSYPGFLMPFQDLLTSNHMAYWAQKYVSDNLPPPPPRHAAATTTPGRAPHPVGSEASRS